VRLKVKLHEPAAQIIRLPLVNAVRKRDDSPLLQFIKDIDAHAGLL
jgi:hypothetical protein